MAQTTFAKMPLINGAYLAVCSKFINFCSISRGSSNVVGGITSDCCVNLSGFFHDTSAAIIWLAFGGSRKSFTTNGCTPTTALVFPIYIDITNIYFIFYKATLHLFLNEHQMSQS